MKKSILAITLISILTLSVIVFEIVFINVYCIKQKKLIEECEKTENVLELKEKAAQLNTNYKNFVKVTKYFLHKNQIDEIETTLSDMQSVIKYNDKEDFEKELGKLKIFLDNMYSADILKNY